MKNAAPTMNTYQLSRLSFGKAMSFAPIIIGTKKFPSTPGMTGMRNKKSMIVPWAVNALLYWSEVEDRPGRGDQVQPHQRDGERRRTRRRC